MTNNSNLFKSRACADKKNAKGLFVTLLEFQNYMSKYCIFFSYSPRSKVRLQTKCGLDTLERLIYYEIQTND